jgi:hypothetical protein
MYFCLFKSSRDILLSQVLWTTPSTSTHKHIHIHTHTHTHQSWQAFHDIQYEFAIQYLFFLKACQKTKPRARFTIRTWHMNIWLRLCLDEQHKNSFRSRNNITSSCFVPWKWTVLIMWLYESRLIARRQKCADETSLQRCGSLYYEGNSISKLQIQVATYVFELSAGNCHR